MRVIDNNHAKQTPQGTKIKSVTASITIFLIFAVSFFFSYESPLNSPPTGIWTLPFIVVSIFPSIPAGLIGGFTCYQASLDLMKCNDLFIYLLYFIFSALYSLMFYFLLESILNKSIKKFLLKPINLKRLKLLNFILFSLISLILLILFLKIILTIYSTITTLI